MSEDAVTISREEQMLGELAELDLALARRVHEKAMAAEDNDEINALGRTYQRIARSLRQTLLAKARLAADRELAEVRRPRRPPAPAPLIHNGLAVITPQQRAHVERARDAAMPYLEAERPDWDELDEAEIYEVLIELAHEAEDFLDTPVETLVARVRAFMGLDTEPPPPDEAHRRPAVQNSA